MAHLDDCNFVVTGATGWLGRASLGALEARLSAMSLAALAERIERILSSDPAAGGGQQPPPLPLPTAAR